MPIDHVARARKAWPLLAKRANAKGAPFTYGGLCSQLRLHHRAAGWFLGVIQAYCEEKELPPLQALVVNQKTRLPGSGYIGSRRTAADHQRALDTIYEKKWDVEPPKFS